MKKKGFTLIELLAVIVILAIIAVITVPKIADMITSSRKGAAEDSFYGALKAAELSYAKALQSNNSINSSSCNFNDGVNCTNGVNFSISGKLPTSGYIEINNKSIAGYNLEYNGYICSGSLESSNPCIKKFETAPSCFTTETLDDGTLSIIDYDISCGTNVVVPEKISGKTVTRLSDGIYDNSISNYKNAPFKSKGITNIILPETLNYIGLVALFGNKYKTIRVPDSVTYIGNQAFAWNLLESVYLGKNVKTIGSESLTHNNLTSVTLPNTIINMGNGIATDNLMEGEDKYLYGIDESGNIDKSYLNSYCNRNDSEVIIPANVKTIGSQAFYLMGKVKVLNIPDTVETLKAKFFYNMPLETVNVGSGIRYIDPTAFIAGASSLNSAPNFKTINIKRSNNAITGAPWGASNVTVNWTGAN